VLFQTALAHSGAADYSLKALERKGFDPVLARFSELQTRFDDRSEAEAALFQVVAKLVDQTGIEPVTS
jgi:hypothetical protein